MSHTDMNVCILQGNPWLYTHTYAPCKIRRLYAVCISQGRAVSVEGSPVQPLDVIRQIVDDGVPVSYTTSIETPLPVRYDIMAHRI